MSLTQEHVQEHTKEHSQDHTRKGIHEPAGNSSNVSKNDKMPPYLSGSCFCGGIRFATTTPPVAITNCHCLTCRKLSGAPFLTYADFLAEDVNWLESRTLTTIRLSDKAFRQKCSSCGNQVTMGYDKDPQIIAITASMIDDESLKEPLPKPNAHIFVREKASWFDITDGLPQYQRFPKDG